MLCPTCISAHFLNLIAITTTAILLFYFFLLRASLKLVPESEEWTVERFGSFHRVLHPGLRLILPWIDQVRFRLSMRERVLDVPKQDIITRDNAIVTVDGVVFYQILDSGRAAYQVAHMQNAIAQLTMTNIRTVMGEMELDSLLSNRETINAKLLMVIDEATHPWGVKVTRIEIKDIKPPADLQNAMSGQMKAERTKWAVILEAEGLRKAEILKAEGKNEALILAAQARKQEAFLQAEAREREAEAEAEAVKTVSKAMGTKSLVGNYFLAQKYIGSLKEMATASNSKTILMPFEATKLIGSLGGIAELTQAALERKSKK